MSGRLQSSARLRRPRVGRERTLTWRAFAGSCLLSCSCAFGCSKSPAEQPGNTGAGAAGRHAVAEEKSGVSAGSGILGATASDDDPAATSTSGGGGAAAQEETLAEGGAPSSSGGTFAEPANVGGDAGIAPTPSCAGLLEGTYCGGHLSPVGEPATRYFCAQEMLLAKAECPGACDAELNECVNGSGTGQGLGDTPVYVCLACYAQKCPTEYAACDSACFAHLSCQDTCDGSLECGANCEQAFEAELRLNELRQCAGAQCAKLCDAI